MIKIIAIRKDNGNHSNPCEAISHFKWINQFTQETGISAREVIVEFLEKDGMAYVETSGHRVYCGVRNNGRIKYVQTYSDGHYDNNLLSLPEF